MVNTKNRGTELFDIQERAQFDLDVKKLRARAKQRPYNMAVHRKLAKLYMSKNMFPEAEAEQEIVEWLDRIRRNVNL